MSIDPVLYGVGVGPGDPELVTLQGVRVLREAEVVFVPVADTGEQGRAERIVVAHVTRPPRRLVFALTDESARDGAWDAAGREVAEAFAAGARSVAFATIGDPNIYSTFTYLAATVRALVPNLRVATVPGITAMQSLAASSGTVLVEGRESLALMPLTAGVDRLRAALDTHDAVVAYKGGRVLPEVLDAVRAAGRLDGAVVGSALGMPEEDIRRAEDVDPKHRAPYLSTLLVVPERTTRGGAL
ncbi:MAG TPA: precorrin-2 C(20)-methyltransferase [Frankiaceae bacterium]|jgi:precorrin-2/cobalt-factor-2 C20-methyltransferase|nr:precorrin-2 C(20)-methyltransferase [Frankiaceae bacterium]